MNHSGVVNAVYDVIDDARWTIVEGIAHQGVQREIKELLKSKLTSPKETYSISIEVPSAREFFVPGANTARGKSNVEYNVELHVIDFAIPQLQDPNQIPYETMHSDFMLVVDRLVKLIKDTTRVFPSATANPKFILAESTSVNVADRSDWYDNGDEIWPAMYAVISFTLMDYCADSSLI